MPRFHAAWSFGSIAGAGIGVPMAAVKVPMLVHSVGSRCSPGWCRVPAAPPTFLPAEEEKPAERGQSAWREPRVLAVTA